MNTLKCLVLLICVLTLSTSFAYEDCNIIKAFEKKGVKGISVRPNPRHQIWGVWESGCVKMNDQTSFKSTQTFKANGKVNVKGVVYTKDCPKGGPSLYSEEYESDYKVTPLALAEIKQEPNLLKVELDVYQNKAQWTPYHDQVTQIFNGQLSNGQTVAKKCGKDQWQTGVANDVSLTECSRAKQYNSNFLDFTESIPELRVGDRKSGSGESPQKRQTKPNNEHTFKKNDKKSRSAEVLNAEKIYKVKGGIEWYDCELAVEDLLFDSYSVQNKKNFLDKLLKNSKGKLLDFLAVRCQKGQKQRNVILEWVQSHQRVLQPYKAELLKSECVKHSDWGGQNNRRMRKIDNRNKVVR